MYVSMSRRLRRVEQIDCRNWALKTQDRHQSWHGPLEFTCRVYVRAEDLKREDYRELVGLLRRIINSGAMSEDQESLVYDM
jgi:hypothetical protein